MAEEDFKRQISRVRWLTLGDHDTKFFHQNMATQRTRNKVLSLVNSAGTRLEDPTEIESEILGYFEGLLGTSFHGSGNYSVELNRAISNKIPENMLPSLVMPVTVEEVRAAVFSIKADKALGGTGYNAFFFQQNWDIIGTDLTLAVQHFFAFGYMLKERNSTAISLIPKTGGPSTLKVTEL